MSTVDDHSIMLKGHIVPILTNKFALHFDSLGLDKILKSITTLLSRVQEILIPEKVNCLLNMEPLLEAYSEMVRYYVFNLLTLHRTTSKLLYVLYGLFTDLLTKVIILMNFMLFITLVCNAVKLKETFFRHGYEKCSCYTRYIVMCINPNWSRGKVKYPLTSPRYILFCNSNNSSKFHEMWWLFLKYFLGLMFQIFFFKIRTGFCSVNFFSLPGAVNKKVFWFSFYIVFSYGLYCLYKLLHSNFT